MGDVEQKLWGTTQTLIDHPTNSTHRIFVRPGGYCSMHYHERKWNAFVVLGGQLTIITENQFRNPGVKHLLPGEVFAVRPGLRHRFVNEGKQVTEALEYYWPEVLGVDADIVRFDEGGVRS